MLQLFITYHINNYLLRISFGKCLSGNDSESAKAAGPPDADAGLQDVGGTGSVGWSVQAGTEVYDSAGAERQTGLRFETAGENLQRVSVQIRRPRWWCFLWGEIPLTLSRKFTRFLQA